MVDQTVRKRAKVIRLAFLFGLTVLIVRLAYIQLFDSAALAQKASANWRSDSTIHAVRGTIYDRNGKKLAYTTVAYNVSVDKSFMGDKSTSKYNKDTQGYDVSPAVIETYAEKLAPLLGMSAQDIVKKVTDGKVGVELKQAAGSDLAEQITKLNLKGVFLTETTKRLYPNDELAAHVLGFMTMDGKAVSGIELQYDEILRGKDGIKKYRTDKWGNPLPYEKEQLKPAVDGQDVWLTLDETVQHYAENALDNVIKDYKPKNASIVVMDPNTGEILAMANRPTYNPNKFWESNNETLSNNWAMNKSFEPGSTFKIVTMTAALNEQKVNLDSTFNSGRTKVGNTIISDWNNGEGWGTIPFRVGFYHSSNVAMIELANRLGWDKLYEYIGKFGFNQKTGIDLPGEGMSQLFTDKNDLNLAVTSFGQGNAVTPMQQVAAVSAVANGGNVMRPFLMKEVRDSKNQATLQEQKPHAISQVATPEVMKTVRDLMEGVVNFDESKKAYLEGYKIAGKTGTAQIAKADGPGYDENNYITSFIGFAPSDKPKLLVYVTVDSPHTDLQFGNVVASPAAKEVFGNVLPMMGYRVENGKPVDAKDQSQIKFTTTPSWNGMNRAQAQDAAKNNQLQVQILGTGDKITSQYPPAGTKVPAGTMVYLFAGSAKDAQGNVQVPNLTGKTIGEAVDILSLVDLGIDLSGTGFVVGQEQKAGSVVPTGTKIKLHLDPNG